MGRPLRKVLADNIRRAMENSSDVKRQEDLEAKAGIGQSTVSRILRAEAATNIDAVEKIARALKVQPWELMVDGDEAREEIVRRFLKPS
jgi:transcriptional regulator with XRE-family HTH domain